MTPEERLVIIRDAFLEGRDREAVEVLLDLITNEASKAGVAPAPFPMEPGEVMTSVPMFTPTVVQPGDLARVYARPQRPFLPKRLIVTDDCARFDISSIVFGTTYQGACTNGPLSAALFGIRRGMPLTFDPVMVGMDMVLAVRNEGPGPVPFRGAFWGVVIP